MTQADSTRRTGAVVVAWKQVRITFEAVHSLLKLDSPVGIIVCVVQEWDPEDALALRAVLPEGSLVVELRENLGFARAANLGIGTAISAGADWVLLLNNDAVVDPRCVGRCLEETYPIGRIAVVGPAVAFMDQPELLWYAGGSHSNLFAYTRHPGLRADSGAPAPTGDTDYVPGCCALISAAAWLELGPYREDFFLYYEDAEWCARAREAGWRCRYVGEVLCWHAVSVSAGRRGSIGLTSTQAYYLARNPLRFAIETRQLGRRLTRLA
ncbi:MAG TPA: glycosyltransferase family 2 protein, partial [Acidimicrobiales bacterium]|nr:glycosyltransferase family 2 protein [Acidimicrobiales bacterium]